MEFEYMDNFEIHGEQWLREEQKLNAETLEVGKAIALLFDDANFTLLELLKLDGSVREVIDTGKKRVVLKQVGVLLNRLRINAEELVKLDKRHEELKLKVLKFYHLPPDYLPDDHLQGTITVKEINKVLKEWTAMCKELDDGESWKDAE